MANKIDRTQLPETEEYYIRFHHQPIHFKCDTTISNQSNLPSNNAIKINEDITIENYFSRNEENQIIKITKIFAGSEIVLLKDRITI